MLENVGSRRGLSLESPLYLKWGSYVHVEIINRATYDTPQNSKMHRKYRIYYLDYIIAPFVYLIIQ